jgi:uncharacterized protein (UPF0332 family)
MLFDWKEYLDISRYLYGNSSIPITRESSLRAAVSRAYYAAFCHARNYAIYKFSFEPSGHGTDHSALRRHYAKTRLSAINNPLDHLQQWREQCDYDDEIENIESMCLSAIDAADQVFKRLK